MSAVVIGQLFVSFPCPGHFSSSRWVWNHNPDWGDNRESFLPGQFSSAKSVPRYCSWETLSWSNGNYPDASRQVLRDPGSEPRWGTHQLCECQQLQRLWVSMLCRLLCVNIHLPRNPVTDCQSRRQEELMEWGGGRMQKPNSFNSKGKGLCWTQVTENSRVQPK